MDLEPDNILDTTQLLFSGDFDKQVMEILCRVRLTRTEVENLQYLLDDLEDILLQTWPGCQVYPFGSIVTGLGIRTSDIDCYVKLPPDLTHRKGLPVQRARNMLRKNPQKFSQLLAIPSAKIPILKFVHIPTGFNCDVNFSSMNGVKNSKLVAFLLNLDTRALPLAVIIKYWSKVYNFTGTNLLPNYALTMMVIFYLQVKSVLPSVAELQRNQNPEIVENWNTAFNDDYVYKSDNAQSLYELLGGFFNYYKNFDYEQHVISPFLGCPLKKLLFADLNSLPHAFSLYRGYLSSETCKAIRLDSSVCIQDPFDHSRNCSVAVFGRLFAKIYAQFELAARMFNERQRKDFLRALFTMDPQIGTQIAANTKINLKNKVYKKKLQYRAKERAKQYFNKWQMEKRTCNKGGA